MKKYDLIIRNGNVVRKDKVEKLDIGILDGKILELKEEITSISKEEINAENRHILPGGYDSHVHFNEPGRTDWETLWTGSSALAAGGMTSFTDMPLNSIPLTTSAKNFDLKLERARSNSLIDYSFWGGLTPNNLENLEELAERGVLGFKAFTCFSGLEEFQAADDWTLYRGMEIAKTLGLPVIVHGENKDITDKLTRKFQKEGKTTYRDFLNSRPEITEIEAIQKIILLAAETKCKVHIAHVSTGRGVRMVYDARKRGVDITCETVPQYLAFTDEDLKYLGGLGKCTPPLRSKKTLEDLWAELLKDHIDIVCSDHSPSPMALKTDENFFEIWGGISGCQSTRNILLTEGYHKRGLELYKIANLTAKNPAELFNLKDKGQIEIGFDADLAIVDLDKEFILQTEDLFYLHKEVSPLIGMNFKAKIERTILRGVTIFQNGKITSKAMGKFLRNSIN